MKKYKVLIVEDEAAIRDILSFTLQSAEFEVIEAANAEVGWKTLIKDQPELIIVDWMLPGLSGVSFVERIRKNSDFSLIPIMMLTAKGEEEDQVKGFLAGVDDYVVKPFSPRALVARCQALLRRSKAEMSLANIVKTTNLLLDLDSYRFTVNEVEVKLGPTEFKLMHFFMTHSNRVYSREHLLNQVWGVNVVVEERTVDVHIRRLRKLLEEVNASDTIQTVRGAGYRFSD
jgi:two-component system phosphate regulon response regulator PhoB